MQEKQKHSGNMPAVEPQSVSQSSYHPPAINVSVQNQNQAFSNSGAEAGRISTKLTMMEVLGHLIIWAVISGITLGIGLLFWPYATSKLVLNSIVIGNRAVRCDLGAGGQIGHMIIWAVLIGLTFGTAFPFYAFGVVRTAINSSRIQ